MQFKATMLLCLGPTVQCISNTLPGEHKSLEEARTALNGYVTSKRNVEAKRHKLRSKAQKADESFNKYVTRLSELVKSCDFGTLEKMIRDQIVEKCSSQTLKKKVLQQEDLDLAKL